MERNDKGQFVPRITIEDAAAPHMEFNEAAFEEAVNQAVSELFSRKTLIKLIMSIAYGYTMGVVAESAMLAISLLTMPAWLTFVIQVASVLAVLYVSFISVAGVVDTVYDAGEFTVNAAKTQYNKARAWFNAKQMSSFNGTKH